MLPLNLDRVRQNVHQATTEDLLDRITVYRAGMEETALDLIAAELRSRGVTPDQIQAHEDQRDQEIRLLPDGTAVPCSFCHRPAVAEAWGWHWLWGLVPLFPRFYRYCSVHRPERGLDQESETHSQP
jgi:hypothetical protein